MSSPIWNPLIDGAPFQKLERATIKPPTLDQIAAGVTEILKAKPYLSNDAARAEFEELIAKDSEAECWKSYQYTVIVHRNTPTGDGWPEMDWLSIRRDDRAPIRDWRHMQAIKNQLCGKYREGVELYPSDTRLVDTANQFHLWVLREEGAIFPFGMSGRAVSDNVEDGLGAVQRPGAAND